MPTLTNPASHPPCGFWTRTEEVALQKLTYLGFAVAVAPTGSMDQVRIVYEIEGENQPHATTFRNGVISEGKSTRPTGTSATYLSTDVGFMPEAGAKFLARPSMITITVDPRKQVAESNEQNNVLRLRVTPANRGKISIADNACTVVE